MATFLDLNDDELVQELAQFIQKLKQKSKKDTTEEEQPKKEVETSEAQSAPQDPETLKFLADCRAFVAEAKWTELFNKFFDFYDMIFATAPDKDVEGYTVALFNLIRKSSPNDFGKYAEKFIAILVANTERAVLRLRLLANLYNSSGINIKLHYNIFLAILQLATASNHYDVIIKQLPDIEIWLVEWKLSDQQKQNTYKQLSDILQAANKKLESHQYMVKALSIGTGSPDDAMKLVINAIKLPELTQIDHLLDLKPIASFATSSNEEHKKLFELLNIFAKEKLDVYIAFYDKNPSFIEKKGLNHNDCLKKMRLLTLASIAAEREEITFTEVAAALKVEETEVERWIINAITAKLVDAKIDQLRHTILITRATQRVFNLDQWKNLQTQLGLWKENVSSLLKVLQTVQVAGDKKT